METLTPALADSGYVWLLGSYILLKTFLKHGKRVDSLKDKWLEKIFKRSINQLFLK